MKNKTKILLKIALIFQLSTIINLVAFSQDIANEKYNGKLQEWKPDKISELCSTPKNAIKFDLTNFIPGNTNLEIGYELTLGIKSSLNFDFIVDIKSDLDKSLPTQTRNLNDTFITKGYWEEDYGFFGRGITHIFPKPPPDKSYDKYFRHYSLILNINLRNYSFEDGNVNHHGLYFDKGICFQILSFAKNTFTFNGTQTLTKNPFPDEYDHFWGIKTYDGIEYRYIFNGPQEINYKNLNQIIPIPNIGIGWQISFKKLPILLETKLSTGYRLNFYKIKPDFSENWFWNFAFNAGYRF